MVSPNLDSASGTGQYQDHPDAPLPIRVEQSESNSRSEQRSSSTQTQTYCDDERGYCESDEAESQPALAQSDPIPIEDDDEAIAIAAASRPRHAWQVWWLRNKGMGLVLLAQAFAASMNVMTQVLEIHSSMHPFQVRDMKRETYVLLLFPHIHPHLDIPTNTPRSSSPACP